MEQLSLFKINNYTVKPLEYIITKANTLIEANYRLTLTQQRIVLLMASMVQPDDEDFKWYRLTVGGFTDLLNIDRPGLYRDMVGMVDGLMRIVLTIPRGDEDYLKTHWVQKAKYKVGGGYVDVSFDPDLKPFFLLLKERFTTYKLENVICLKSVYSIRIYELLKQYQGIGKRTLTIEALRKMLGIDPKKYRLYGHFKDKVILVAHKEINEKTDLSFSFREIKHIRKITELEFTLTKKTGAEKLIEAPVPVSLEEKAAARLKKKVKDYKAKLSPEELERLTTEATEKARQACSWKGDHTPKEALVNGCLFELVAAIVGKKKGK